MERGCISLGVHLCSDDLAGKGKHTLPLSALAGCMGEQTYLLKFMCFATKVSSESNY